MNKWDILKSLAPGFLPLLIFIAADALWGTQIGLMVAVAIGIIELIISYLHEKIIDRFILLDVGLIVVLGGISILLENDIFFKLKPALIEAIFCLILGISVFSPMNIMLMMSKRYMKNIELNTPRITQLNKNLRALFYIFSLHTLLIIYAAFFLSKEAWAFISSGLFYILFAVYFIIEVTRNKLKKKNWEEKYKDDEWFDIVDEQGRIKGRAPRSICHSGPGLLHPVVHLHVVDSKNRIFLQKRAKHKKVAPGKWDTAVGGHLASGETIEQGLKREAAEELNLRTFQAQLVHRYTWTTNIESELVFMFICRSDENLTINPNEIEEGKYWKIKKIKENLGKNEFSDSFEFEFNILTKILSGETKIPGWQN